MERPEAYVTHDADGKLVLVDPAAASISDVLARYNRERALENCKELRAATRERTAHFVRRVGELALAPKDVAVVVVNVDDAYGAVLASALMPNEDWNAIRARGEVPIANGIVMRDGLTASIAAFDACAAAAFARIAADEVPVVVIHAGIAAVFHADGRLA